MWRIGEVRGKIGAFAAQLYKLVLSLPMSLCIFYYHNCQRRQMPLGEVEHAYQRLHVVYFVLASEAKILELALRSLLKVAPQIDTIYIVMDKDRPLTSIERDKLGVLSDQVKFSTSRFRMGWGGPRFVLSKMKVLHKVLRHMGENDLLVSLDPDVLFKDDSVFREAMSNKADSFGHRVMPPQNRGSREYMQGGCYFLSKNAVEKSVTSNLLIPMWRVGYFTRLWLPNCPEDFLFSELTKELPRKYGDFMSLVPEENSSQSVLHFTERNKLDRMLVYLDTTTAMEESTDPKSIVHCPT